MALARDASSPASVTGTTTAAITTASFTPPGGSLIVACVITGNSAGSAAQGGTMSDSLGGSWVADKTANTTGAGDAEVYRRTTATSGASMTVTWTPSGTNGKGSQITVHVLTGAAAAPLGASASGTAGTVPNIALTPSGAGNFVCMAIAQTNTGVALTGPQAGCTTDLATNDATNGETYGTAHLTALTVSTASITVGFTNTGLSTVQIVAVEYLAAPSGGARIGGRHGPGHRSPATMFGGPPIYSQQGLPISYAWQITKFPRVPRGLKTQPRYKIVQFVAVPPQEQPAWPTLHQTRALRGLLPRGPGRIKVVVPPQFNPPFPWSEIRQPRLVRGSTQAFRRAEKFETIPPQFNPPYPWAEIRQPRIVRGLLRRKVSRPTEVVPAQVIPLDPNVMWSPPDKVRFFRGMLRRPRMRTEVTPPQEMPIIEAHQPRAVRSMLRRKVQRLTETTPPQFNPPYPTSEIRQPRILRGGRARKVELRTEPPIDQTKPIDEQHQQRSPRGLLRRRVRLGNETTPPQFNPPYPTSEIRQPRATRSMLRRKVQRPTEVVPAQIVFQQNDVMWTSPSKARTIKAMARRGRMRMEAAPPQVNPPYPTSEIKQPRTVRGLLRRKSKPIETPLVAAFPIAQTRQSRTPRTPRIRAHQFTVVLTQDTPIRTSLPRRLIRTLRRPGRSVSVSHQHGTVHVDRLNKRRPVFPRRRKPVITLVPQIQFAPNPPMIFTRRQRRMSGIFTLGSGRARHRFDPTHQSLNYSITYTFGAPSSRYNTGDPASRFEIGRLRSRYQEGDPASRYDVGRAAPRNEA